MKVFLNFKLTVFLFFILFSSISYAASTPEFWKLTKKGQTLWILGSVHVADQSFYPLPNSIMQAFTKAERLYLEFDMSKVDALERETAMASAKLPAGDSLKKQLNSKSYRKFTKLLQTLSLPEKKFQHYKPWYVAISLVYLKTYQLGYQPKYGIDNHFSEMALKQKKTIYQFETFSQQMALLAKIEPHQQKVFDSTIEEIAELDLVLKQMMSSWKSGNSHELQQLLLEQSGPKEVQEWMEISLLSERNSNWLTMLEQQKPKSAFIVVGALHVGGKKGLVQLLKQTGFKAEIVK